MDRKALESEVRRVEKERAREEEWQEERDRLVAEMPRPGSRGPHVPARMEWGGGWMVRLVGDSVAEDGDLYLEYVGEPNRTWHHQAVGHRLWPNGREARHLYKGYLYRDERSLGESRFPYELAGFDLVLEDESRPKAKKHWRQELREAMDETAEELERKAQAQKDKEAWNQQRKHRPSTLRATPAEADRAALERANPMRPTYEAGPSAALAAKPAEPRGAQVFCMGDWYDDLENL